MDPAIERAIVDAVQRREPGSSDIVIASSNSASAVSGAFDIELAWKAGDELRVGTFTARPVSPDSAEPQLLPALAATAIRTPQMLSAGTDPETGLTVVVATIPRGQPLSLALASVDMRWQISALAFTWARSLARIHALDWRTVSPWMADPESVPEDEIDDQVEAEMSDWRDRAERLPSPEREKITQALEWLELRRPIDVSLCLCHGSFTPEHVLIESDEVRAIFNWDNARVTDASYDLATLRSDLNTIGMRGDDADLFAQAAHGAYLQASPRGLANIPYYSVARPLDEILDALEDDSATADLDPLWDAIERAMRDAGRVPWRA